MMVVPPAASRAISSNSRAVSREVSEVVGSSKMMMPGIELQRLGDLDQLPLARGEPLDQRVGRQGEVDRCQQRRASGRRAPRGRSARRGRGESRR